MVHIVSVAEIRTHYLLDMRPLDQGYNSKSFNSFDTC